MDRIIDNNDNNDNKYDGKSCMNNDATANIDFIFAITLLLGAIMTVIMTIPSLSHEDRGWRIEQYTTTARVTDNLVNNEKWLEYDNMPKVLDRTKIIDLIGTGYIDDMSGLTWWEFPKYTNYQIDNGQINSSKNVSKKMGIEGYNFYVQLYPVGLSSFNSTLVGAGLTNVSMNIDTVSTVDRYVYVKDDLCRGGFVCYTNVTVHYKLSIWMW